MTYSYKSKSYIKTPAAIAGSICEELAQRGVLTPQTLLDASREADAPLHGEFEWDDAIAAEEHRKAQARHVISCIVIHANGPEKEPVRAFVAISTENGNTYQPLAVVVNTPSMYTQMLANARSELRVFAGKYERLVELSRVASAINQFLTGEAEEEGGATNV